MSFNTPYSTAGAQYGSPQGKPTLYPPSGALHALGPPSGLGAASPGASHSVPELPVSDILYGYGEWRDVQPVVRSTIKTLYDTVQLQAATIRQLQRSMLSKAEQSDLSAVDHQLNSKISYTELNDFADDLSNRMVELNLAVSRKPDSSEIAAEIMDLRNKLNDSISPAMQRWLEAQSEKTKQTVNESQRQLHHHSGLVSDALEVAARHREVELEAQKVWVDDQLRKMKKGFLESGAKETSEREKSVLSLWKEVRSLAESASLEQTERRAERKETVASQEALSKRLTQTEMDLVGKLAAEREARQAAAEAAATETAAVVAALRDAEARLQSNLDSEAAARAGAISAVRLQLEGEAETRTAVVAELNSQITAMEQKFEEQVQLLDDALEAEKLERAKAENGIVDDLLKAVGKETDSRIAADTALEADLSKAQRAAAQHAAESLQLKAQEARDARLQLKHELQEAIKDAEAKVQREASDRQTAVYEEAQARKEAVDTLRAEAAAGADALRGDVSLVRSDLAAAENFLGERVTRETEERRKADAAVRADAATDIERLKEATERRAQEVQRTAVDMSRDLSEMEFSKRDNQYSELKAHVDFCTKGTADEVIQMWQYVQRIDTDVRDVVLRLDNRMAKIYGRTWK